MTVYGITLIVKDQFGRRHSMNCSDAEWNIFPLDPHYHSKNFTVASIEDLMIWKPDGFAFRFVPVAVGEPLTLWDRIKRACS